MISVKGEKRIFRIRDILDEERKRKAIKWMRGVRKIERREWRRKRRENESVCV